MVCARAINIHERTNTPGSSERTWTPFHHLQACIPVQLSVLRFVKIREKWPCEHLIEKLTETLIEKLIGLTSSYLEKTELEALDLSGIRSENISLVFK